MWRSIVDRPGLDRVESAFGGGCSIGGRLLLRSKPLRHHPGLRHGVRSRTPRWAHWGPLTLRCELMRTPMRTSPAAGSDAGRMQIGSQHLKPKQLDK